MSCLEVNPSHMSRVQLSAFKPSWTNSLELWGTTWHTTSLHQVACVGADSQHSHRASVNCTEIAVTVCLKLSHTVQGPEVGSDRYIGVAGAAKESFGPNAGVRVDIQASATGSPAHHEEQPNFTQAANCPGGRNSASSGQAQGTARQPRSGRHTAPPCRSSPQVQGRFALCM